MNTKCQGSARRLRVVAAVCLGITALPVLAQAPPSAALRGRVIDAATLRPVASAVVQAVDQAGTPAASVRAAASGRYEISTLPPGRYAVSVTAPDFQPAFEPRVRVGDRGDAILDFALVAQPGADTLQEVVVSTRARSADPLASVSSQRLDREEIRRSPGTAGDVFRGLDILPGVASTGEFSQFAVRGNNQRDNLILIDGIPFDKVVHFAQSLGEANEIGGGGRFSIFAPDIIASAEFQPGGWRAAEGGRNGSLLALDIAGGNTVSPRVRAQLDLAGAEFAYEGPIASRDNASILLSARSLDFERLFKTIDNEDIGVPSLTDMIGKFVLQANEQHRFGVLAINSRENYQRDVANVLASENFQDTSLSSNTQDSSLLGLTWEWLPRENARLRQALYARDSDKESRLGEAFPDLAPIGAGVAQIPVRDNILTLTEREKEFGWRIDYSDVLTSGHSYTAGARVARQELDFATRLAGDWIRYVYDRDDFRPNSTQQYLLLTPRRVDANVRRRAIDSAAYADFTWVSGAFKLTPGVRIERHGFAGETLAAPRFAASWQPRASIRLWAGAGDYYQSPSWLTLAADPANATLRHERSRQAALGVQSQWRANWRWSAEVYRQSLDRLVVASDRADGVASNRGRGTNRGLELSFAKRSGGAWWGSASYAYLQARRDDQGGAGRYRADQDRPHVLTLFGAWDPSDRWALSAKWKYASGRPRDPFIVRANVLGAGGPPRFSKEYIANNTGRFPAFHALNVRADYRRRWHGLDMVAFIDVVNVYGRAIVDEAEWDERRGVDVVDGLEVFPTLGVKFEYVWPR